MWEKGQTAIQNLIFKALLGFFKVCEIFEYKERIENQIIPFYM